MKKKSLSINAAINVLRNIVNIIFPLITFPYASRVLGVNGMGIYNFSYSICNYFILIAALGISTYAIREGARYRNDIGKLTQFASEVFSINIVSTILTYIIMFIILANCNSLDKYVSTILLFSVQIFFITLGVEWLFAICEEFLYITVVNIIFKVASIFLLFIFVRDTGDYIQYAAITVFSVVCSNLFSMIYIRKRIRYKIVFPMNVRTHIFPILIIFASNIAVAIYVNIDVTMLGFMCNDYAVGIYSVATKIYNIIKNILAAILIVYIPRLSALLGTNKRKEFGALADKVFDRVTMILIPTVFGIIIFSREIVLIVGGSAYQSAETGLKILGVALLFSIFSWLFSQCVLIPLKFERKVLEATVISAVANIILNIFMIPVWRENAAALTTVISELISSLICGYYAIHYFSKRHIIKNIVKVASASVLMSIIVLFLKQYINSVVISLVSGVIIGAVTYFGFLKLFKYTCIEEISDWFQYKVKNRKRRKEKTW